MADFDYGNQKGRTPEKEIETAPWWVGRLLERMDDLEKRIDANERSIRRTALIKSGIRACLKKANDMKAFWFIGLGIAAHALGIEIDWNLIAAAIGG